MIGNDVVDLEAARRESNWQREGFLEKIFTAEEQELILSSGFPELLVWVLWSMKEAAYKVYNRKTGVRAYNPTKLICSEVINTNNGYSGKVNIDELKTYTHTTIQKDLIHTVAVEQKSDLQHITVIAVSQLKKDSAGLPYITLKNKKHPVTKSHHGRFEIALYAAS